MLYGAEWINECCKKNKNREKRGRHNINAPFSNKKAKKKNGAENNKKYW